MKAQTRFVIFTWWANRPYDKQICSMSEDGVLWIANTARVSKRTNAAVFTTRAECNKAIKNTNIYARKKNFIWATNGYQIVPITIKP